MTIATKMHPESCNFACNYCFQTEKDRVDTLPKDYDLDKVKETMKKRYERTESTITIHSGDPTALPKEDLEELLKYSYELSGKSSIQTNGWKVDQHWELFEKYNTNIGFSFDGPEECNILRGFGDKEKRLEIAREIENNIYEAIDRDLSVSIITVIHRQNAIKNMGKLKNFLLDMKEKGISGGRLNPISITSNLDRGEEHQLTMEEMIKVYDELYDFLSGHGLTYSPFMDMAASLRGDNKVVCKFSDGCDPYGTPSLQGIYKEGQEINCLKLYRGDYYYLRKKPRPQIREQVLKETDCKECPYWFACKGGCPNDAINDDWRRKSRNCELYKHLFERIRNDHDFLNIDQGPQQSRQCDRSKSKDNDHSDGVEHIDGENRHLDSSNPPEERHNKAQEHTDGVEHIDGETRHLDSG